VAALAERCPGPVRVALGMRYGNPSIASALAELRDAGARRLLVLPLYPQYSATTVASTFDAVAAELRPGAGCRNCG
jgi:ferrochelatase